MTNTFFCIRRTSFGSIAVVWSEERKRAKILRILLPSTGKSVKQLIMASYPYAEDFSCSEINIIADRLEAFLKGDIVSFSLDIIRMDLCSGFQQKVLRTEHGIPRGKVSTYQRIAKKLGKPNAARAVGNALANNPFPIIIPCHRTIRSDGTIGGFGGGVEMKKALLEMEGVFFNVFNRVAKEMLF